MPDATEIEDAVRRHYAAAANTASACCSVPEGFGPDGPEVYGAARYDSGDLDGLPAEAVAASIGCANPVALADLHPGDTVLDLGSGGGIDVLLSARRVGPTGKAYGVDMTDEMLELARANQQRAGVTNAEFLRGRIEEIPLPDDAVDVIVSNCVINLSTDKPAVFAEANRLLRPGGRLAVADVVADAAVDEAIRGDLAAWTDCVAGAVTREEYRSMLEAAGFVEIAIVDSHPVADGFTSVLIRASTTAPTASR
jgi:arsenite methyltransferase